MTATSESERKNQLKEFQRNAQRLLTEDDRDYLHYILKEYQTYKSVDKLVQALKSCLDSPTKLDLLSDIRNLIPAAHLNKFDSLVPYQHMAHPMKPPFQQLPSRKTQSLPNSYKNSELRKLAGESSLKGNGSIRVVSLVKADPEQSLGFSIRGGREHGSGIFVSQVDDDSEASKQGLRTGDHVIEVNGIDFEQITHSSAVNLLASLSKVKLVVKTPGTSENNNSWAHHNGKVITNGGLENGSLKASSGSGSNVGIMLQHNSHLLDSADERRVSLAVESTPSGFIGFNLRGGADYGTGLFVSGVDPGSLAEQAGFQVGDQILDVNGKDFENIKHKVAVDFIKAQKHIVVTLKAVGRLPEAKHYRSQISWIYPDGSIAVEGKEEFMRSMSAPPGPVSGLDLNHSGIQSPDLDSFLGLRPESREAAVQTPEPSPEPSPEPILMSEETSLQSAVNGDIQQPLRSTMPRTTSTSTSSDDREKRHSVHSTHTSGGSVSSREDFEKRYTLGSQEVIVALSDNEGKSDKAKVKKSKSFLQKHGDKIRSKLSFRKKSKPKVESVSNTSQLPVFSTPAFEKGFGSQIMLGDRIKGSSRSQMLPYIEEKSKKMLVVDEHTALIRHLKQYQEDGNVESLVHSLLAILDKPEKALLLRDIRTLVLPYDLGRFDAMVSAHEKEALEYLSTYVPGSPTIIPTAVEKPKRQLVTAVQDSKGSFQLRSKEETDRLRQAKEEQQKQLQLQAAQWLGGSILDRHAQSMRTSHENIHAAVSASNALDAMPVRDAGMTAMPPPPLSVPMIQVNNDEMASTSQSGDNNLPSSSNTLLVPDRVAAEYQDDDDGDYAQVQSLSSTTVPYSSVPSISVPSISVSTEKAQVTILLPKKRTSLGISISGGKGSKTQPEVRVEKIFPGGAAADDGRLKNGDQIVSVDGTSLADTTHAEAVDIIRKSYHNKTKDVMEIVVIP